MGRDALRMLGPAPRLEAVAFVEGADLPTPVGALRLPSRRSLAVPLDGFVQRFRDAARS
ncbi:hypothetical protein [Phenylobacterium sp. J367]|uniref:hypothetical protein n=1 Tax=Phenylobacterium sp. J367 TaxID=2898435 RepID=UPI002150B85A|nr:hypothetical protein [Phenylobacterium sp. J367]MCR5879959.1 hypothetical protein [Phenylobacterium sp. J367]